MDILSNNMNEVYKRCSFNYGLEDRIVFCRMLMDYLKGLGILITSKPIREKQREAFSGIC